MSKVSKPKEFQGRVRYLNDEERNRLLKACREIKEPFLYPVVILALSTGARKSEILNLKWENVDFTRCMAIIHATKNGERRALPLSSESLTVLETLKRNKRKDSKLLFPNMKGDKPFQVDPSWKLALKQAEIHDFRFHDLRHCAASYLAMNGATLLEIAHVLGHKTLRMVKRYSHLSDQHIAGVVEKMNRMIIGK